MDQTVRFFGFRFRFFFCFFAAKRKQLFKFTRPEQRNRQDFFAGRIHHHAAAFLLYVNAQLVRRKTRIDYACFAIGDVTAKTAGCFERGIVAVIIHYKRIFQFYMNNRKAGVAAGKNIADGSAPDFFGNCVCFTAGPVRTHKTELLSQYIIIVVHVLNNQSRLHCYPPLR